MYQAPGAIPLPDHLKQAWNQLIVDQVAGMRHLGSAYLKTSPDQVANGELVQSVKWSCAPAEPRFCLSKRWAQTLSDWGIQGRHKTHNEYCEYHVTYRFDGEGRLRPKRVEFTTELREFWVMLAEHDPDLLRQHVAEITGSVPSWGELYGDDIADPHALSPFLRKARFSLMVAGNGRDPVLEQQLGVPDQPLGRLNQDHALFMSHPINGLDDLVYIVMFGARPYAVERDDGTRRRAEAQEIFRYGRAEHLQCRNADSAAAAAAYDAVWKGKSIAFADPLGMYIRPLQTDQFFYNGGPLPAEWVRYSRGAEGMWQRLVFGPPDDSDAFLDDIHIRVGASDAPITGGYQIAEQFEVGPLVVVGEPSVVPDDAHVLIPADAAPILCREADVCVSMHSLKDAYEAEQQPVAPGTRGGGAG